MAEINVTILSAEQTHEASKTKIIHNDFNNPSKTRVYKVKSENREVIR